MKLLLLLLLLFSPKMEVMATDHPPKKIVQEYYKEKKKKLFHEALLGVVSPIPIYSTLTKNLGQWKKYRSCRNILKILQYSEKLLSLEGDSDKKYSKYARFLNHFLDQIKRDIRREQRKEDPLFVVTEDQKKLNNKILSMEIHELAKIINFADQNPSRAFINPKTREILINEYSLRYKLRKIPLIGTGDLSSIFEKDMETIVP